MKSEVTFDVLISFTTPIDSMLRFVHKDKNLDLLKRIYHVTSPHNAVNFAVLCKNVFVFGVQTFKHFSFPSYIVISRARKVLVGNLFPCVCPR
jgi:hypothetical protein